MFSQRTSNPVLKDDVFASAGSFAPGQIMTIQGTVNKSFLMLALLVASGAWIWHMATPQIVVGMGREDLAAQISGGLAKAMPFVIGGGIMGFILALVTIFKKEWAGFTAPAYAICEGLVLGGVSAMFELRYPGIVTQAVMLTLGTLFCLLMAYKTGIIRVTDKFRLGVMVATGAIGLLYLVSFILGFFHVQIPFMHGSSLISIGLSLFIVGIAALNLVLDFDFIEQGAQNGAPKYMEWFGSFALMVTLVWLYMEILSLLSKLRER
ncbi:MAG: Bax inhibitor-1/YccA family protein [Candidatus Omnitrophica bacterium]|nr:Bax inhibitor-1/YccA family protein [Candidatus Omnitrophota bacterium]